MKRRTLVVAAAAIIAILLGASYTSGIGAEYLPASITGPVRDAVTAASPRVVLLVIALGAILLGLWRGYRGSTTFRDRSIEMVSPDAPPESPQATSPRSAAALTNRINTAIENGVGSTAYTDTTKALRRTTQRILTRTTDQDDHDAVTAIVTGDWTDDAVAAATLAPPPDAAPDRVPADEVPYFSLTQRLYAWVRPNSAAARRLTRTITAIETAANNQTARDASAATFPTRSSPGQEQSGATPKPGVETGTPTQQPHEPTAQRGDADD